MSTKIRASKKQPPSLFTSLPKDIIVDITARVPRCHYPTLSLVCKHFRSLVASPELYTSRSLLGFAKPCLYVFLLNNNADDDLRCYILHRKTNRRRKTNGRLVIIPFLPTMPNNVRYVAVGLKIYVFGETDKDHNMTASAITIDCISHKVQTLPSMPIPLAGTVVDFIDGKIYIIGYCDKEWKKIKMVVFNTTTQMWEPEIIKPEMEICPVLPGHVVVMADNMYVKGNDNTFVYDPKESTWGTDEMLNSKRWVRSCVVDDVLYYYDGSKLRTYDPKKRCWGVVKGLRELLFDRRCSGWSETVSYGGKLALLFRKQLLKLNLILIKV
ncbi:unnamed protein product [Microthlaspi erraticum]|uniref:F-box domain-containing protein n=1 Tax=Microthlaspi erraticum TaxID=1685480 RepID=A0A6D2JDX2_9BRAS|nr:unnamed protein product [Microthlaspi erraticum]